MKPVHLRKLLQQSTSSMFVTLLLIIVLAACGSNAATVSSPSGAHAKSTEKKPTATSPSLLSNLANLLSPNAVKINVQAGNLLIQSDAGFQCPAAGTEQWPDQLVLASGRATYSKDEIQQMRDSLGSNAGGSPETPPTLRWVLGGSVDPIPGTPSVLAPETPCGAILNLTNTGSVPIQIPKIGVQLEARSLTNSYQYHLINYCSVIPQQMLQGGCYVPFGGGPECDSYAASIQLGAGVQNDVFSTMPVVTGDPGCGILTIAAHAQVKLTVDFSLAPDTPKNLIYSFLPIFTLDTAQGRQVISLSQLTSTLAFASVSQFSCYTLQGTTFVLETPTLASSLTWNWCM